MSLAAAVPVMAGWKLSNLPKGLESDQLDRVLGGCDRRTPMGRRDYAVLLLLSRPGLCAGKIARLGLDDIDWAHGEITIVGKSNRLASKKDWDARERDVKPISPALSPNAARSAPRTSTRSGARSTERSSDLGRTRGRSSFPSWTTTSRFAG